MERLSKEHYLMMLALAASARSTCYRRQVGAVLALNGRVLSTGYNGAPPGMAGCIDMGHCLMVNGHCVNTIHAEQNALLRSREQGDTLVSTDQPCLSCLKMALAHNPEIRILYWRGYPDEERNTFMECHHIRMYQLAEVESISQHLEELSKRLL